MIKKSCRKEWYEKPGVEVGIRVTAEYPSAAEALAEDILRGLDRSGELSHYYFGTQPTVMAADSKGRRWVIFTHSSECSCVER